MVTSYPAPVRVTLSPTSGISRDFANETDGRFHFVRRVGLFFSTCNSATYSCMANAGSRQQNVDAVPDCTGKYQSLI